MLRRWNLKRSSRLTCRMIARTGGGGITAAPPMRVFTIDRLRAWDTQSMVGRVYLCAACFVVGFFIIGFRMAEIAAASVSTSPGDISRDQIPVATARPASFPVTERPAIKDRHGVMLAMNQKVTSLEIETRHVWDAAETAQRLADIIEGIDVPRLAQRIKTKKNIVVKSALTHDEMEAAMLLGLPGVHFTDTFRRAYPQGALGAHLVGYTVPGRGGAMGLEKTMDIQAQPAFSGDPALSGDDRQSGGLVTTVDFTAQQILEEELANARHSFQAKAAWGVIMDVRDGAVIAMASQPGFNPNAMANSPVHHLRNRAMYDRYELGSAFKAITAAAALEVGATDIYRHYDVSQPIKIADKTIGDFYKKQGQMQLPKILQSSSNIGIAHIARDLGIPRQQMFLQKLGLLDPLVTDLPEKRAPSYPANWGPVESATIAYGHGISVTALQLAAAFAAVINDGCYRSPYFVRQPPDAGTEGMTPSGASLDKSPDLPADLRTGLSPDLPPDLSPDLSFDMSSDMSSGASPDTAPDTPSDCRQVFSPFTTAHMRLMLRKVVTEGTARAADVPGYYPVGKTATADKSSSAGGYEENVRISSFLGAFPGYDPHYALLVSFDEPQDRPAGPAATGSVVAAPVFSRIVARLAPSLGLPPVTDELAFAGFVDPLRTHRAPKISYRGAGHAGISPASGDAEGGLARDAVTQDAMTRLLRGITREAL